MVTGGWQPDRNDLVSMLISGARAWIEWLWLTGGDQQRIEMYSITRLSRLTPLGQTTHKPVSPWTWLATSLVHMLLKYLSWNLKILKTEIFVKSNIPINEIMPVLHILYLYGEKLSTIHRTLQRLVFVPMVTVGNSLIGMILFRW